jgi:uncharacterized phage-associated protein
VQFYGSILMRPAAPTSFDIAIWFLDRARAEDTYLQPRKLQCLLFLAQAHFAAAHEGQSLMPGFFIVDDSGPLDPNVYRTLLNGRPKIEEIPLDYDVVKFLDAIWAGYKNADALRLDQVIARRGVDEEAVCNRDLSEVTLVAMQRMFGTQGSAGMQGSVKSTITGPTLAETATGRKVTITKWSPGLKKTSG